MERGEVMKRGRYYWNTDVTGVIGIVGIVVTGGGGVKKSCNFGDMRLKFGNG